MLHIAYYDPFSPNTITIERIQDWCSNPNGTTAHIIRHGSIPRYSSVSKRTILVKSCNLYIFEMPYSLFKGDWYPLRTVLTDLWKQGKLHSFDISNYPELLI